MSDGTSRLRQLADDDELEAELIRYLVALGGDPSARGELSLSQAEALDATAAGWREIADASDAQVENPDLG